MKWVDFLCVCSRCVNNNTSGKTSATCTHNNNDCHLERNDQTLQFIWSVHMHITQSFAYSPCKTNQRKIELNSESFPPKCLHSNMVFCYHILGFCCLRFNYIWLGKMRNSHQRSAHRTRQNHFTFLFFVFVGEEKTGKE